MAGGHGFAAGGRGFAALRGLPCEPECSPSRHGPQAICGTASAAVIERQ